MLTTTVCECFVPGLASMDAQLAALLDYSNTYATFAPRISFTLGGHCRDLAGVQYTFSYSCGVSPFTAHDSGVKLAMRLDDQKRQLVAARIFHSPSTLQTSDFDAECINQFTMRSQKFRRK